MTTTTTLTIDLVPSAQWGANLKLCLRSKDWDAVRRAAYRRAGYRCEVCGGQGSRHPVEAHEVWCFSEEEGIQRLDGVVALCPACHEVKHYGRAANIGRASQAQAHLAEVNGWDRSEVAEHVRSAIDTYERRERIAWTLDLSLLERDYGIEPPSAAELEHGRQRREAQIAQEAGR